MAFFVFRSVQRISNYLWPQITFQFYKSDAFFAKFPDWIEILMSIQSTVSYDDWKCAYKYVTDYCSNDLRNEFEVSPLFHAAKTHESEDIEFIKIIVDCKLINLHEVDQEGNTIFHYIINESDVMRLFADRLKQNAEVLKIQNANLQTPIDKLQFGEENDLFIKFPEWREILLHLTQNYEDYQLVEKYIRKTYNSRTSDEFRMASLCKEPLQYDVIGLHIPGLRVKRQSEHLDFIKVIAKQEVLDKYLTDPTSWFYNIFHQICNYSGDNKSIGPIAFFQKKLEDNPNLLKIQDSLTKTPIDILISKKKLKLLNYLLGIELIREAFDFQDKDGNTYLHQAARQNNYDVTILLINKSDIDINAKNDAGKTAFHYVCEYSSVSLIRLYLSYHEEQHIILNEEDYGGNTPVKILSSRKNPELDGLLLDLMIAIGQIEGTIEEKQDCQAQDIWSEMDYMNDDVDDSSDYTDEAHTE